MRKGEAIKEIIHAFADAGYFVGTPLKLTAADYGLCGTAAVISPVGKIVDHGKEICFPSGMDEMGPITKKLYDTLTGIQMGKIKAPEGWIVEI